MPLYKPVDARPEIAVFLLEWALVFREKIIKVNALFVFPFLLPDDAEKAGFVDFDDVDIDLKFGGQGDELRRSKRGCPEAVLADNDSVRCFLFIDFAQESFCGLNSKPIQAVLPKFLRVGRKKDDAIFPGDADAFRDEQ